MEPLLYDEDQSTTEPPKLHPRRNSWTNSPLWLFTTVALAVALLAQSTYHWSTKTYEQGFSTEIGTFLPLHIVKVHVLTLLRPTSNLQ